MAHIHVLHGRTDMYGDKVKASFGKLLPRGCLYEAAVDEIADTLIAIIKQHANKGVGNGIAWGKPENGPEKQAEKKGLFGLFSW